MRARKNFNLKDTKIPRTFLPVVLKRAVSESTEKRRWNIAKSTLNITESKYNRYDESQCTD